MFILKASITLPIFKLQQITKALYSKDHKKYRKVCDLEKRMNNVHSIHFLSVMTMASKVSLHHLYVVHDIALADAAILSPATQISLSCKLCQKHKCSVLSCHPQSLKDTNTVPITRECLLVTHITGKSSGSLCCHHSVQLSRGLFALEHEMASQCLCSTKSKVKLQHTSKTP